MTDNKYYKKLLDLYRHKEEKGEVTIDVKIDKSGREVFDIGKIATVTVFSEDAPDYYFLVVSKQGLPATFVQEKRIYPAIPNFDKRVKPKVFELLDKILEQ